MDRKPFLTRDTTAMLLVSSLLGAVILLCNLLTDLCVDDFTYLFSLSTKERITSFLEIFPSLAAHAKKMNGRLTAHFLTHLFLLLPEWIFRICNTLIFLLQIILITKLGKRSKGDEAFLVLVAFFSLWLFEPVFGQVNLWLDGACNYLWSATASLLFLLPFSMRFLNGRVIHVKWLRILFVPFGWIVGNFMENSAVTVIVLACALMLLSFLFDKQKPRAEEICSVIATIMGLLCMMLAPAEMENKIGLSTLSDLWIRLTEAWKMLSSFGVLLIVNAILLILACYRRCEKKICLFAFLMTMGGIFSHFLLIFASYYPERCAAFTVVLLTCCAVTLMRGLLQTAARPLMHTAIALLLCFGIYHLFLGVHDVYTTHLAVEGNVKIIEEAAESDVNEVHLPIVSPKTKYSALYGLRYLSEDPNDWPNRDMARYFGVSAIIGYQNSP